MNPLPRHLFAKPPGKSALQDGKIKLNQSWMIPSAVFVTAVTLQNKFPLSSKFSRNPGSTPKTYTQHMFCRPRESIRPASSWKALEGVVGVRCWWVPLAGSQVTVFLWKRLRPCWRR